MPTPDLAEWCRAMPADAANEIERLRAALKPFADYAPKGLATVPGDLTITNGSLYAKRQLLMSDCYSARDALQSES